jgi:hypothetical protein
MNVDDLGRRAAKEAGAAIAPTLARPTIGRVAARRRRRRVVGAGVAGAALVVAAVAAGARIRWTDDVRVTTSPAGGDALLTCDAGLPFPAAALDRPGREEQATDGPAEVLRSLIAGGAPDGEPVDVPATGWRRLASSGDTVVFGAGPPEALWSAEVHRTGDGWVARSWGRCRPAPYREDRWAVRWRLDPDRLPAPDATTVHLVVENQFCFESAEEAAARLDAPVVDATAGAVVITMFEDPLEGDVEACGGPGTPVTVDLGGPLGDRLLLDGSASPPAPRSFPAAGQALGPFTRSGGCGDVVVWAADDADEVAMFVEAFDLLDSAPTTVEVTLPDDRVDVEVAVGSDLTAVVCGGTGGRSDPTAMLRPVAGTVTLTIGERAADGTAPADLVVSGLLVEGPDGEEHAVDDVMLTGVEVGSPGN